MSLFNNPQEHADNPPDTWQVEGAGRIWRLVTSSGIVLDRFETKRAATAGRKSGFVANLYDLERRWYAGEQVRNWKSYAEVT